MRAFLRAASIALAVLTGFAGVASAQQKFAYIRSAVLLDQAPGRAEAEAQFERDAKPLQEQIKRMNDSLNAMVAAFEKSQASLNAATREARGKEIQAKGAEFQRRIADLQTKGQQRQTELVTPIYDRVKTAIEEVRAEGGYSFILNYDQPSVIVAADKNLDVTDRVIMRLRAGVAVASPAISRPAAGAPAAVPTGVTRPPTPPLD